MNSFEREKCRSELVNLVRRFSGNNPKDDVDLLGEVANLIKESSNYGQPRPCCSCGKPLKCLSELGHWGSYQPTGGCEITVTGAYGSFKHDMLTYKGIICDECVSNLNLESESYI